MTNCIAVGFVKIEGEQQMYITQPQAELDTLIQNLTSKHTFLHFLLIL